MPLTLDILRKLWPDGNSRIPGLVEAMVATSEKVFTKYGINSDLLIAHLMAQISHECGGGTEVVENLSYSAERMTQVWPSRFPTLESAEPFAYNAQALANRVYNGRMGNSLGTNDGWNYRGRGATQTTGKDNYTVLSIKTGYQVLANPDLINFPSVFLECGAADFIICGCLPYAKNDDVIGVTRRLNGGIIGLQQRKDWLFKWNRALAQTKVAAIALDDGPLPAPEPIQPLPVVPEGKIGHSVFDFWDFILSSFRR